MTSGQINDGKAAKAESDRTRDEVTLVVRTAMDYRSGHSPDRLRFHRLVSSEVKLTANAAHDSKRTLKS
jgi:hypothetical protein